MFSSSDQDETSLQEKFSAKSDLDNIANEIIVDLLDNKRFQQYWSELVLKILQKDSLNILLPDLETQSISNVKINFCKESYCTNFYKTIIKSLNDLSYAINLAVETFMYNSRLATNKCLKNLLFRESTTIYSIRVQLDRFCAFTKFKLPQFGLIARRFTRFLKVFTISLSSPYSIQNCFYFASSICDMLYQFDDFLFYQLDFKTLKCNSHSLDLINSTLKNFHNSIDYFYINLVKRIFFKMQSLNLKKNICFNCGNYNSVNLKNKKCSKSMPGLNLNKYYQVVLATPKEDESNHIKKNSITNSKKISNLKDCLTNQPRNNNFSFSSKKAKSPLKGYELNYKKKFGQNFQNMNGNFLQNLKINDKKEYELLKKTCVTTNEIINELTDKLKTLK